MVMFSVVVPTRNRGALLTEALRSLDAQSFDDFEVIVVDDASTDDTAAIVGGFAPKVRLLTQSAQQGVSVARNAGIAAAKGKYVCFLDDDDLWMPWTLATYAQAAEDAGDPAMISSNGLPFRDLREVEAISLAQPSARAYADYLAYACSPEENDWLLPTGVIVRRDVLQASGGFDTSLNYYEDEDLWMRLGDAPGFLRIDSPLCWAYRVHGSSASSKLEVRFHNIRKLLVRDARDEYPGGASRTRERTAVVTQRARHLARLAAKAGLTAEGLRLYRDLLKANIRQQRWKFLLLFPIEAFYRRLRPVR